MRLVELLLFAWAVSALEAPRRMITHAQLRAAVWFGPRHRAMQQFVAWGWAPRLFESRAHWERRLCATIASRGTVFRQPQEETMATYRVKNQTVEAVQLQQPRTLSTPFGQLSVPRGHWIVTEGGKERPVEDGVFQTLYEAQDQQQTQQSGTQQQGTQQQAGTQQQGTQQTTQQSGDQQQTQPQGDQQQGDQQQKQ